MTIGTTISSITVDGNGVTTAFAYPFLIPAASDAVVTYVAADGTTSVLTPTQFTISGIGNAAGGTVTYPLFGSPIGNGTFLVIARVLPLIQATSVSNQGPTFAAIESALDYEMMCIQQISGDQTLSLTGNISDPAGLNYAAPPVSGRALQMMGWDASGNVIAAQPSSALVSSAMQPVVAAPTRANAYSLLGGVGTFLNAKTFGAVGDGVTDDTNALNAMLSAATPGQQCWLTAPGQYLVDSGNLVIPIGVQLCAGWSPPGTTRNSAVIAEPLDLTTLDGAIVLNPAHTITMASGSGIKGVPIYRKGLSIPAPNSNDFSGTAISVQGDDCYLGYLLVLGFTQLSTSTTQVRGKYEWIFGDNQAGIAIVNAYDTPYLDHCHFFPYCTYWSGAVLSAHQRSGIGYKVDGTSLPSMAHLFCYGYQVGYEMSGTNAVMVDCQADNTGGYTGSIGFSLGTPTQGITGTKAIGCVSFSQTTAYYVNTGVGDYMEFSSCSADSCGIAVNLAEGSIRWIGGVWDECTSGMTVALPTSVVVITGLKTVNIPGAIITNSGGGGSIYVSPSCDFSNETPGFTISTTMQPAVVASASTLELPLFGDVFEITGTTTINVVSAGWANRKATLIFGNAMTVTSGLSTNSVRLNASTSFTSSTGSTLALVHNGFQWFETGRCA